MLRIVQVLENVRMEYTYLLSLEKITQFQHDMYQS